MPSNRIQPRSFAPVRLRPRLATAVAIALCAVAPLGNGCGRDRRRVRRAAQQGIRRHLARAQRRRLDAGHLHHGRHAAAERASQRALPRGLQQGGRGVEAVRRQADESPHRAAPSTCCDRACRRRHRTIPRSAPNSRTIMAGMEAKYGEAKYCKDGGKDCRDEVQLKTVLEQSRNYDELLDAWRGWHDQARGLRPDYIRFVELANEGARDTRLQGRRRDVALGLRHAGRRLHAGKPRASTSRSSRSTGTCTAMRAASSRRSTARTRCRRASRSRRTCSATCGRSNGMPSTTSSSRIPA